MTRVLAQNVVGNTSDEHTRAFRSDALDDTTLDDKEVFLGELVVVEVTTAPEKGLYHVENATKKTFLLITPFEESLTQSTLLGCQRQNLLVVISNVETLGKALANFTASTTKLATNVNDEMGRLYRYSN